MAIGLVNALPRRASLRLGAACGTALYHLVQASRFKNAMQRTIKTAFPDISAPLADRLARGHARALFTSIVEVARIAELPRLVEAGTVRVSGLEHVQQALRGGRGAVILSAHMGNWELLISLMGLIGHPVHAVVVKQTGETFNRWLTDARERFGSKVLYSSEATSADILRILSQNGIVLLLADHHHYRGEGRNIVQFFGRPVSAPGGPVAYSLRAEAPLIPAYGVRTERGEHHIRIEAPLILDRSGTDESFKLNCERYLAVIERWIRAHPEQWMWSHERWAWLDEDLRPIDAPSRR